MHRIITKAMQSMDFTSVFPWTASFKNKLWYGNTDSIKKTYSIEPFGLFFYSGNAIISKHVPVYAYVLPAMVLPVLSCQRGGTVKRLLKNTKEVFFACPVKRSNMTRLTVS